MSKTIDERVVEMRFDNKQFEAGVSTSLSTLDKLKKSLDMKGATNGFENLEKAANKVDMTGLGNAVETVKMRFSALEVIAVTALANITNSVINTGKQMLSALTIDPIKTGFQEYETQIGAIQTILANTSHQGTNLQQVNNALDELNHYADKTIYNFTQMTRNIGTFTAAGVDLQTSVDSIKGIANLAAVSGSTSQQASTAMYQLSQALAAGKVSLMDWNSVVNAGMGGKVFQDALVRTSELLGTGAQAAIDTYGSFRESLTKGEWLTTEVLTETLKQFAGAYTEADLIQQGFSAEQAKSIAEMAKTAEDAATKVKTFTQLWDTLKEGAQSGWTQTWEILVGDFEEAKELLTEVSDVVGNIISKSAEARNELLGGALSSGWKQLLDQGIQDEAGYIEAIQEVARKNGDAFDKMVADSDRFSDALKKGLQDGVISSETLSDAVFALQNKMSGMSAEERKAAGYTSEMVTQIETLATGLKDGSISMDEFTKKMLRPSGRENIIQALWNAAKGLMDVLGTIKEAFREIFPPTTSEQIYKITENLRKFTENLKLSEAASANLKSTFKGLFAILDIVKQAFSAVFRAIRPLFGGFGDLGSGILSFTGSIGDAIVKFDEFIKTSGVFQKVGDAVAKVLDNIISAFRLLRDRIQVKLETSGIKTFGDLLEGVYKQMSLFGKDAGKYFSGGIEQIKAFISRLREMDSITLDDVRAILKDFKDNVVDYFLDIDSSFDNVRKAIDQFKENIKTRLEEAGQSIDTFKGKLANFVLEARSKISDNLGMGELLTVGLGAGLIVTIKKIGDALEKLAGPFGDIANVVKNFNGILESTKKAINAFALQTKSKALLNVAFAIATLAGAIALLTLLDQEKMWSAVGALGVLAAGLLAVSTAMGVISKIGGTSTKNSLAIVGIAASLLILVGALKTMESLDGDKVWGNVAILGVMVGGLALVAGLLGKLAPKLSKGSLGLIAIATSLKIMVSALEDLDQVKFEHLDRSVGMLLGVLASLTVVSLACKSIKLSSAVGVLALAASLKIFISTFEDFAAMDIDNMKSSIQSFATILTMFAGLMAASKFAGANAAKAGVGILAMSASLILVMISFKMIASMDKSTLSQVTGTVSQILLVFGAVVALSNFAGANAAKAGAMLLMMSGALVVLSGAIVILSHIEPDGLTRAVTAISVLEIMFAGLIAVTALAQECKSTLILLSVTIGILAVALGTLSMISPENLKSASLSLSAVIATFAMLVASTSLAKSATGTLAVITAVVAALGGVIYLLAGLPANSVVPVAEALALLLTSLSVSILVIGKMGTIAPTALAAIGVMTLIVAGLAAIIGVLASMNLGSTLEIAVGLSTLLLSLSAACAILTLVGAGGPAAFIGIGALATLIVGIGGLMAGVGALVAYFPDMELFVSKGISLLEQIGYGIGSFFGNIASGLLETMSSSLPVMGENLSLFMTNMQPFFDSASGIDASALAGVKALAETILILTAANILDSLTSWFTGGASMTKFGQELAEFAPYFSSYYESIKGIDGSVVESSANAAKALAEFASEIPNSGGVVGWFAGENSLSAFAQELMEFGPKLKAYADSVQGLDADVVVNSANAAKALAEMANNLPNSGGVVGWFAGENDLSMFADELMAFGPKLKEYADSVAGLDSGVVVNSANAAKALAEMAGNLPNQGGAVSWFTGDNTLSVFGTELSEFGPLLKAYADSITGLDASVVTNSANAAKALAELSNNLPNSGGIVSWFTGDNDIASFGEQLVSFGQSFAAYYNSVSGVDAAKLSGVVAEFRNLVDLANGITSVDTSGMSTFAQNLTNLGNAGVDGFINAFTNAGSRVDTAVNTLINGIVTAFTSKYSQFTIMGQTMMTNFISGIRTGDASARSAFVTIVSGCLTAIRNKFYEFNTVGQTTMTNLIAGIRAKNQLAKDAFVQIINSCLTAIRNKYTDFYNAGKYLVEGFAKGIDEYTWYAEARARAMARAAAQAAEAELDINSPSKVGYRIGGFFGMGFVNSLIDYTDKSYDAGASVAKSAKEGLRNAVSKIGDFIENGIDSQPTIRPLLDLSDVTEGAGRLSALLSRNQAMKISAGMEREGGSVVQNSGTTPTSGNNYNFTQNNYSPKALSRIDIYRQTKNQFSALKGLVET